MSLKRELIFIDGKDKTDEIKLCRVIGNQFKVTFKNSKTEYTYRKNRIEIIRTGISEEKAKNVFDYLKRISEAIGLKTEEGSNILSKSFDTIRDIPNEFILSSYLNSKIHKPNRSNTSNLIFPFGFNLSQIEAVKNAFSNGLSVIEGPPGTGKTQTILNIIANAVIKGKNIAIVSSNNSATKNVYEKLEKCSIEFISALLGNAQNKKEFIEGQSDIPNIIQFKLSKEQIIEYKADLDLLFSELSEFLDKKNELATIRLQLEEIRSEYKHFKITYENEADLSGYFKNDINEEELLTIWHDFKDLSKRNKKVGFFKRLLYRFKYGITDKLFYSFSFNEIIIACQFKYFEKLILVKELEEKSLNRLVAEYSFEDKMKKYLELSMKLFKSVLYKKYSRRIRPEYTIGELQFNSYEFIKDYPVIMSTTYSLRRSLSKSVFYDYLIIDESSQVDIATGALAFSCAKKAVIVGDLKQLPNVLDDSMKKRTDDIFKRFEIPEYYRYSTNSILSSIIEMFPNVSRTLLREHYRCHPKIIDFCNKKFYNNQLIIHTEIRSDREPLVVYRTRPGNHARDRMNQRQIDIIQKEIIPQHQLIHSDLGIVTPYRNQTNALQQAFQNTKVKADTVDKFQGRENNIIILSTVDNEISDFTDNPNRLNVAVSRAVEQLIVVVNGNEGIKDNNINDLIRYIEYNNFSVVKSELSSIFDYLYKGYEDKRRRILEKNGKISEFDSENLMYALIKHVLKRSEFSKYNVVTHFSLGNLIRDYSKLDDSELKYVTNALTHLDFLIYNRLSKFPVLAIEVDGYRHHKKGTKQYQRDVMKDIILKKYGLPIIRFTTTGSNEEERLINVLSSLNK